MKSGVKSHLVSLLIHGNYEGNKPPSCLCIPSHSVHVFVFRHTQFMQLYSVTLSSCNCIPSHSFHAIVFRHTQFMSLYSVTLISCLCIPSHSVHILVFRYTQFIYLYSVTLSSCLCIPSQSVHVFVFRHTQFMYLYSVTLSSCICIPSHLVDVFVLRYTRCRHHAVGETTSNFTVVIRGSQWVSTGRRKPAWEVKRTPGPKSCGDLALPADDQRSRLTSGSLAVCSSACRVILVLAPSTQL